ncbi:hypothetical protein GIB67_033981, partial [Kingdonia uniflora]
IKKKIDLSLHIFSLFVISLSRDHYGNASDQIQILFSTMDDISCILASNFGFRSQDKPVSMFALKSQHITSIMTMPNVYDFLMFEGIKVSSGISSSSLPVYDDDDIFDGVPGFGGTSGLKSKEALETNPNATLSKGMDDPFIVLEPSSPVAVEHHPSAILDDLLEEVNNFDGSFVCLEENDPFEGFSGVKSRSSLPDDIFDVVPGFGGTSGSKSEDVVETNPNITSSGTEDPFIVLGQTKSDGSSVSLEKDDSPIEIADDVWLKVFEIPLFTPPTSAPPPSRIPPSMGRGEAILKQDREVMQDDQERQLRNKQETEQRAATEARTKADKAILEREQREATEARAKVDKARLEHEQRAATEARAKARLEREQIIEERQKNALAEKNQRELQTQRDQEEKNMIAETLDIEIKGWVAGKQDNLLALLSTLQYVLWPECGWQPVSLAYLMTGANVKRVYQKATLCIHPDKLQQKGATLQQKYIAEKVFYLLKEAWNKFNS